MPTWLSAFAAERRAAEKSGDGVGSCRALSSESAGHRSSAAIDR